MVIWWSSAITVSEHFSAHTQQRHLGLEQFGKLTSSCKLDSTVPNQNFRLGQMSSQEEMVWRVFPRPMSSARITKSGIIQNGAICHPFDNLGSSAWTFSLGRGKSSGWVNHKPAGENPPTSQPSWSLNTRAGSQAGVWVTPFRECLLLNC